MEGKRRVLAGDLGDYAGGKASPFAQWALNTGLGEDFRRRPMPWSHERVIPSLRKQGIGPYTWGEYVTQSAAPIPFEEAIKEGGSDALDAVREVWSGQGMERRHIEPMIRAMIIAGLMGGTGARVTEDKDIKKARR